MKKNASFSYTHTLDGVDYYSLVVVEFDIEDGVQINVVSSVLPNQTLEQIKERLWQ